MTGLRPLSFWMDDPLTSLFPQGPNMIPDLGQNPGPVPIWSVSHAPGLAWLASQTSTPHQAHILSPPMGPRALTIQGTAGPDRLVSGLASDSLAGLAGDDTLIGGGGNDTLDGGKGIDRMEGGTGNDTYLVDVMGDKVIEADGAGIDTVIFTSYSYVLPANVENLTCKSVYNALLVGNELDNIMVGSNGWDTLAGGGGSDRMKGGLGNDTYHVGNRGDLVMEEPGAGWDRVFTDLRTYVLPVNVEEVQAISADGMRLTGNDQDNYLGGDRGNDTLVGGAGTDGMTGWSGMDVMTGGTGWDYFQFYTPLGADNVDTITDFDPAIEEIDLQRNGTGMFNALPNTGWMDPSAFKRIGIGGSAVDWNDRILYDQAAGMLYYDPDGSGAQAKVLFAILSNNAALTAANFWVFDL